MSRKFHTVIPAIILAALVAVPWNGYSADITFHNVPARVYFSPGAKQIQAIVKEIDDATMEILVQSYSLESPRIAKALQSAARRAVTVEVMVDKSRKSAKNATLMSLVSAGIPVFVDNSHVLSRNEMMVIDKTTVITGAFGLATGSGEKNGENALIIRSKDLAGLYIDNWLSHKQHSGAYQYQGKSRAKQPAGKRKPKQ